ncbi:MAG: VWA domain-containing protein [Spirochaetaceae bacterium]|jgi:Ca-activated chloride channel family protein|nr:VWA domain-containing protein [Spirochaetaceae bacterium]
MPIAFEQPIFLVLGFIVLLVFTHFGIDAFTVSMPLGAPGAPPFNNTLGFKLFIKLLHILQYTGLFLVFVAASAPYGAIREPVFQSRGADIIFVLDVSPSMAALDMDQKSRFTLARMLIQDFIKNRPADAFGLVALGSDAALLVPPTIDHTSFLSRLDQLRLGEMGDGTALGTGIALGALHLHNSTARRRVLVLISDGENNAGALEPNTAATLLPDMKISLWVIGVGKSGEVPIDYLDPYSSVRHTGLFESRFDPENLKTIASSAGGEYVSASSASAFAAAFARINDAETVAIRQGVLTKTVPYHEPVLLIGALLIVLLRLFF